jgi:hypothetical protein
MSRREGRKRTASQNLNPLSNSALGFLTFTNSSSIYFKASSFACFTNSESALDSLIVAEVDGSLFAESGVGGGGGFSSMEFE